MLRWLPAATAGPLYTRAVLHFMLANSHHESEDFERYLDGERRAQERVSVCHIDPCRRPRKVKLCASVLKEIEISEKKKR